ncbi:MAG: chaplin family protein [Pseudonocardia sp.]
MDLRRIVLAGVTGALMLAGTTTAYALEDGHRKHDGRADAVGSVHQEQNGNTQSVDLVDVNVCGNTVNSGSTQNPAFGNTCVNQ